MDYRLDKDHGSRPESSLECEALMRFTGQPRTCASSSYRFDSSSTSILLCNTSNCFVEFANGLAENKDGYGSCGVDDVGMDIYLQIRPNTAIHQFFKSVHRKHNS